MLKNHWGWQFLKVFYVELVQNENLCSTDSYMASRRRSNQKIINHHDDQQSPPPFWFVYKLSALRINLFYAVETEECSLDVIQYSLTIISPKFWGRPVSESRINFVPSGTCFTMSLTSLDTLASVRGGKFSIDMLLVETDDDDHIVDGVEIVLIWFIWWWSRPNCVIAQPVLWAYSWCKNFQMHTYPKYKTHTISKINTCLMILIKNGQKNNSKFQPW